MLVAGREDCEWTPSQAQGTRPYRLLLFSPGFAPYAFSENLVNSKLALAMLDRGWQIEVISARDEGPTYVSEWKEPWLCLRPYTHQVEYRQGSRLRRVCQRVSDTIVMRHPVSPIRWARRAFQLAMRLHHERSFDFVLSRSVSDVAHLPAMRFAKATGIPWLANWNDPPGYLFPAPYRINGNRWAKFFSQRYLRDSLLRATVNTFPSQRLACHLCQNLGVAQLANVAIIPHLALNGPSATRSSSNDSFQLCHAGNLCRERDPRTLFAALGRLQDEVGQSQHIEFQIIGVIDNETRRAVDEFELQETVRVLGPMDYPDTMRALAEATVNVLVEAPMKEGVFLPSKLADYVQAGRPILALSPVPGSVHDLMSVHGGGVVADPKSEKAVDTALSELFHCWERGRLDHYSSGGLRQQMSATKTLDDYESIFGELQQHSSWAYGLPLSCVRPSQVTHSRK